MKANNTHTKSFDKSIELLESQLVLPTIPSKDEIWHKLEKQVETPLVSANKHTFLYNFSYVIAAAIVVLLGLTAVLRYYTTTVSCKAGQTASILLPDNSSVVLNANSKLSYNPLWWMVSRELHLNGEAWFNVTKGNKFKVYSKHGSTTVLGTQFNIYARSGKYRVACLSGRVKVESNTKKNIILNPSDEAEVVSDGNIIYHHHINLKTVVAWKNGMFIFTATPLEEVVNEMERRYNELIELQTHGNALYTGSFPDSIDLMSALNLVCKPFDLNFARKRNGTIVISK